MAVAWAWLSRVYRYTQLERPSLHIAPVCETHTPAHTHQCVTHTHPHARARTPWPPVAAGGGPLPSDGGGGRRPRRPSLLRPRRRPRYPARTARTACTVRLADTIIRGRHEPPQPPHPPPPFFFTTTSPPPPHGTRQGQLRVPRLSGARRALIYIFCVEQRDARVLHRPACLCYRAGAT
jgi:hypothetical protein